MNQNELSNKSVFLANNDGHVLPLSVEEMLAKGFTNFKGWWCAIGVENLHITAEGEIYGGACRNSGHLGNVYEQSYHLKKEWHVCTTNMCHCGADMQVRKVKDLKDKAKTYQKPEGPFVSTMNDASIVAPVHQQMHKLHPLTLTWDLGRRCNYSCSYCNPSISNNYEAHRTMGSLRHALEGLEARFLKNQKAKFVFTGGEPTINPAYLDFVKLLSEKGHFIHTTTNGSRLPEYYADLLEISMIGFSYHMEFAKPQHYAALTACLIEKKQTSQAARNNWCAIRIMVPPGLFLEAEKIKNEITSVPGFAESGMKLFMSPLYEKEKHSALMSYDRNELEKITVHA